MGKASGRFYFQKLVIRGVRTPYCTVHNVLPGTGLFQNILFIFLVQPCLPVLFLVLCHTNQIKLNQFYLFHFCSPINYLIYYMVYVIVLFKKLNFLSK